MPSSMHSAISSIFRHRQEPHFCWIIRRASLFDAAAPSVTKRSMIGIDVLVKFKEFNIVRSFFMNENLIEMGFCAFCILL